MGDAADYTSGTIADAAKKQAPFMLPIFLPRIINQFGDTRRTR